MRLGKIEKAILKMCYEKRKQDKGRCRCFELAFKFCEQVRTSANECGYYRRS